MNVSPYLEKPIRTHSEARRERSALAITEHLGALRHHLDQAELAAKKLYGEFPMDSEAYDRAVDIHEHLEELFPDWLVPAETAAKEWLEGEDE